MNRFNLTRLQIEYLEKLVRMGIANIDEVSTNFLSIVLRIKNEPDTLKEIERYLEYRMER